MVAIIVVFKSGQNRIIQTLNEQKSILARQKQEIADKARELEKVESHLRFTNLELKQFAYVVSHDLKQPLRNINSFSALLQRHFEQQGKNRCHYRRVPRLYHGVGQKHEPVDRGIDHLCPGGQKSRCRRGMGRPG